ncbi:MAG: hypothetical protein R2854_15725 [Caldilineaceae bacterium]
MRRALRRRAGAAEQRTAGGRSAGRPRRHHPRLGLDLYPAGDAPGMLQIVALYPNGNAEQVSVYLTKGAVMEYGTWTKATAR